MTRHNFFSKPCLLTWDHPHAKFLNNPQYKKDISFLLVLQENNIPKLDDMLFNIISQV